jgi:hypothetical protein
MEEQFVLAFMNNHQVSKAMGYNFFFHLILIHLMGFQLNLSHVHLDTILSSLKALF